MNSASVDLSVIIPAWNRAHLLPFTVKSVQKQKYKVREIVVVDDGSTDGTAEVARAMPGVRYVYRAHQGLAATRNHGLKVAEGSLITILDADDRWTDSTLDVQLRLLEEDRTREAVCGCSQRVIIAGWEQGEPKYEKFGYPVFYLMLGTAIMRREVFQRAGCFNETIGQADDTDWYIRAMGLGVNMHLHPNVVLYYLRHDSNMSLQTDLTGRDLLRIVKLTLDRRRNAQERNAANLAHYSAKIRSLVEHLQRAPAGE